MEWRCDFPAAPHAYAPRGEGFDTNILREAKRATKTVQLGDMLVLGKYWAEAYYHFWMEWAPKIMLLFTTLERNPQIVLIYPKTKALLDFLALTGLKNKVMPPPARNVVYHCQRIYFTNPIRVAAVEKAFGGGAFTAAGDSGDGMATHQARNVCRYESSIRS